MKQTVYTANSENQQIHVWSLNHNDSLTLTQVVDVLDQVQLTVVSPNKCYLYVDVRPESCVLAYRIAPGDGTLAFAAESALPESPTHISTDHQGRFVFVGSYNAGSMSVTRLEDDLSVELVDAVRGLDGCRSANISPDNRVLWVPASKQGRTCLFDVSDDGHPATEEPTKIITVEGTGPHHMAFHPSKQYAYCMNKLNSSVNVWELKDSYGKTECVQTLDMTLANSINTRQAADIHITSDGRRLYARNHTTSLVAVLSVSGDGNVLAKEGFQPTKTQPCGFSIDNGGKYLIVTRQKSHHIAVYEVAGKQGLLTGKDRYMVGQGPMWMTINAY